MNMVRMLAHVSWIITTIISQRIIQIPTYIAFAYAINYNSDNYIRFFMYYQKQAVFFHENDHQSAIINI